ncbi:hypothetical protein [Calidifontibacter terrae]
MFLTVCWLLVALLAFFSVYAVIATARGRAIDNALFYLTAAVELAMLVALVAGVMTWTDATSGMSKGIFIAYLIGMVIALPVATVWAFADRETRWGTGVLAVAGLGLLVMTVRLVQLWSGHV